MKKEIHKKCLNPAIQKQNQIIDPIIPDLSCVLQLAREKGASSWPNALPIEKHKLWLTKSEFQEVLCIRYGWDFKNAPSNSACGSSVLLSYALHCLKRRCSIIIHNEISDLFNKLMKNLATKLKSNHICGLSTTKFLQILSAPKMSQDSKSP